MQRGGECDAEDAVEEWVDPQHEHHFQRATEEGFPQQNSKKKIFVKRIWLPQTAAI